MIPIVIMSVLLLVAIFRLARAWNSEEPKSEEWIEVLDSEVQVLKSDLSSRSGTTSEKLDLVRQMVAGARAVLEVPIGADPIALRTATHLANWLEELEGGRVLGESKDAGARVEQMTVS